MIHNLISINKYEIKLDYTVKDSLKSFKEEVLDELYRVYKLNGDIPLLYSGGMDSTFILRSLQELGISPRIVSFSFTEDNSDFDCELVKAKCKKYDVRPPEFFYIDGNKIQEHVEYLVEERDIAYPMLHGFFMDYFLSVNKDEKYFTGMSGEFKLKSGKIVLPYGPLMVKQNNPDRLFCFTSDRTFLSYFKHKQFIANYKNPNPLMANGQEDQWYIRDLIYMDCYPDMEREIKNLPNTWRYHITTPFYKNVVPYLTERYPLLYNPRCWITQCEFDPEFLVNL
ncbi:hypothetical protein UFOVP242_243 [uncultured Caudovirales phage]|uniref:Asparagine synthase n=1 Tax=uncultured Caudovirales phage TaxID=2100421 RepID=A0A6J7WV94_9CAUD|nr:hypothetical protein UFOVP242_243 [uncultured Caudovirales phage]